MCTDLVWDQWSIRGKYSVHSDPPRGGVTDPGVQTCRFLVSASSFLSFTLLVCME